MMSTDIGIDLGTASILVYIKGKGVVLKEPSVVAFDRDTNKIKAIGEEARLMLGRTPGNIVAVRPLRQGVISDYTVTEKMIKYFIQKALGKKTFRKPRISVCVPSGVTEVEKKAVEDATYQAGAREVSIIEEPIAAAIGAGIDIARPCGNMIVDIGGGTADIAVISLGGSVVSTSVKIAGDDFDEAIVRYMRKKHNLLIGERTAEDIKIKIGTCFPLAQNETMDVRGRNLVTGLPKTVTVSSEETEEALREPTLQIVEAVHSVLEKTPPELAADVADRGIVLTGAVLVEIGYHDNYSDALWLESHVEDVARQLVKALTEYFGLPFIPPMDPKRGTVRLSYGTLNLRSTPSPAGTVIANLPNGAEVTVYGEWNGWYVVQYGDQVGYAAAAYIDV